ncbi:Crp/Fnr family transcriptional regulator [Methylobacterium sp. E-045]|jgi:CRP-like cAMP-binding protein|uniref:Crp/Fnr family transcriptional regulator n=1 Tax=Methylobacterium sp. E-045 TaxID=2836575 RepID=UPI001FBAE4C6|nr:Crp/Fnr family transcriptional regulator [Methylobacterium sp. E-045]MCJ2127601.1 Crp/Fnr family transcriptional regulator [Methylobacterium sp. E-045]
MARVQQSDVRNRLLKAMTSDDFALVQPHLQLVDLPIKYALIEPDIPVPHLYFLESGISSATMKGAEGHVEVGLAGWEGLSGAVPVLLGNDRIPHDNFMQVAGHGLRIGTEALCAAVEESPSLRTLLLRYVQTEFVQARQTAYVNATYTTELRLARWLLMCHDRVDGDDLPVKHEFLAVMLGVQRTGVTLALQVLEGAGRIRGRRGRITVTNRELLEQLAGDSYGAAEAEYARLIEGA